MSLKAPPSAARPLIEAGTHIARLVWIIDLGTHEETYPDGVKILHKVRLSWETPEATAVFKEGGEEQPFMVSKDFTFSMHEKSTLRKFMESWRGKALTNEEAAAFDFEKILGQPCLLTLNHKASKKSGAIYAEIVGIAKLMKGQVCARQINGAILYTVDQRDNDVFHELPEFLQEKIQGCKEWTVPAHEPAAEVTPAGVKSVEDADESVPF